LRLLFIFPRLLRILSVFLISFLRRLLLCPDATRDAGGGDAGFL
jgi:hypothetical protein